MARVQWARGQVVGAKARESWEAEDSLMGHCNDIGFHSG